MSPRSGADSLFFDSAVLRAEDAATPSLHFETMIANGRDMLIAGIDEAGRGPLAGPVVAAAVVLDRKRIPEGIADSKKLSRPAREALLPEILGNAEVAWCAVDAATIDRINILQATMLAMTRAFRSLPVSAERALIDGRDVPAQLKGSGHALIGGDRQSLSVAAASIVAKCVRDRLMCRMDGRFPGYGFANHAGYGTAAHMAALKRLGPCVLHRRSFAPVAAAAARSDP